MNKRKITIFIISLSLITIITAVLFNIKKSKISSDKKIALTTVNQGELTISVMVSGTLQNREQVIIKNQVEGKITILWLIEEGETVKKGDLLLELDSSNLEDSLQNQKIAVQNSEATFINAREKLAVTESQGESDIAKAELDYRFSKEDLIQYKEGEYPQALMAAENEITIAKEEKSRAENKYQDSQTLAKEKLLSRIELEADRLSANKATLRLKLVNSKKNLLENYTCKRKITVLNSDIVQAKMALARSKRKASANNIQAKATFIAKQAELKRKKDSLLKYEDQLKKCRIIAPVAGMVLYATTGKGRWGKDDPLEEGTSLRERQELIYLPTADAMKAKVKIHESNLKKVAINMPATITVDAIAEKSFTGKVEKIGLLPDSQSMWMNPDLKVYSSDIFIEGRNPELRAGMNCTANIIVKKFKNAIYLPLQCVVRHNGKYIVYLPTSKGIKPQEVMIGLDNGRMIVVKSGLKAGQQVLLSPPLTAEFKPFATKNTTSKTKPSSHGKS